MQKKRKSSPKQELAEPSQSRPTWQDEEPTSNSNPASPDLGGLHVIGTTRHQSRRIDRQLRGRCARQGDPGSSKFYVSFEDSLMRLFTSPRITTFLQRFRPPEGEADLCQSAQQIDRNSAKTGRTAQLHHPKAYPRIRRCHEQTTRQRSTPSAMKSYTAKIPSPLRMKFLKSSAVQMSHQILLFSTAKKGGGTQKDIANG